MKHLSLLFILFLTTTFIYAQHVIEGTVVDHTPLPLPGANVQVKGTSDGSETDFDGNFRFSTEKNSGVLVITYIGFLDLEVPFDFQGSDQLNLGEIQLREDTNSLEEIVIIGRGVIDLAADRKTPIAVSTVTRDEMQLKSAGNVEFPNVMKNAPSVYVSNESGGFGDSQIFVRGFDQRNTAFLFNGQPINDMTNGKIYWSNWSGLSDIANAVQMQRGLGSSKLAISSVGGTMNMITKATAKREGGFGRFIIGNDSYMKGTVSYDTGMDENGWGFSFLLDYWQSHAKYANGTHGVGQTYFFSVGKQLGKHNFNLLLTGSPQEHDQNFSKAMRLYERYGRKYNSNYGFKNGEYLSERTNYYHKPILNLNWDWDIDEGQQLSTVVYASMGRGGGTGAYGNGISYVNYPQGDGFQYGAYTPEKGLIDWDHVIYENGQLEDGYSRNRDGTTIASSVNNHQWYGTVLNYNYDKIKNLSLNIGGDLRFYRGDHFRQLTDKLGLEGRIENMYGNANHTITQTYSPNPWASLFNFAPKDQRANFDYSEDVNYQGVFGQAEWANDQFTAFIQGSVSNQSYQREDRGNFAETKKSKTLNKTGYNIKSGVSYNFLEDHIVFVNAGKYSRQPHNNSIFTNYDDNTEIANNLKNETILGLEAGYRFDIRNLQINFNAYYTKWQDRFISAGGNYDPNGDDENPEFTNVSYLFTNIAQLHQGLELDMRWKPNMDLTLHGYATVGKWEYDGRTPVRVRNNDDQSLIVELETDLKETKVGEAPQTNIGFGVDYDIIPAKLKVYSNWNYYTNFYGFVDVEDAAKSTLDNVVYQPEKLNSYSLIDLGAAYTLRLDNSRIRFSGNVYNLFNHWYVNQKDNYGYYLGNGRTYNVAVRYSF